MPSANPWLVRRHRAPAGERRLFCFHHAGGNANQFVPWSNWLPPGTEVVGIQMPGRGLRLREPLLTAADALIHTLGGVLAGELDERPFGFFGHSMGALLAFEMARWLAAQGLPEPAHLFVSGRAAPHLPLRMVPIDHLPDADMVAALGRLGGVDDVLLQNPELLQLFLPMIRADLLLHRSHPHRVAPALRCPITALASDGDALCSVDDMRAWQRHSAAGFELRMFEGGHFFFHKQPQHHVPKFFTGLWPAQPAG